MQFVVLQLCFTITEINGWKLFCTKGCRAKGLKYYDYVHSDLDNVKDHIHQTEVGTKIWQDLMEPLKKTRDKNQKMQSFHPIYIAPV